MRHTGAIVFALLVGGVLATTLLLASSLRQRLYDEHLVEARFALESVADPIARAHRLGVPLQGHGGTRGCVGTRASTRGSGLTAVRLLDAGGDVVWQDDSPPVPLERVIEVPIGESGARLRAGFELPADRGIFMSVTAIVLAVTAALALPFVGIPRGCSMPSKAVFRHRAWSDRSKQSRRATSASRCGRQAQTTMSA